MLESGVEMYDWRYKLDYQGWAQFGIVGDISHLETTHMKNDFGLMRKILVTIYERTDLNAKLVEIDGYDALLVARHVERLYDDGFIDGAEFSDMANPYKLIFAKDLTSFGHDFLGALENEGVWNQIKAQISPKELTRMSLVRLFGLANGLMDKYFRDALGL